MTDLFDTYQECFDNLIEVYSSGQYYNEIKEARTSFVASWGEINENDPNHEARLQQFFDWYILDRPLNEKKETPALHYLSKQIDDKKETYKAMTSSLKSILKIKKIKKDSLTLKDLLTKKVYILLSSSHHLIFKPGLILEGRLIFMSDKAILSKGFCLHPKGSARYIQKQVKIIRKIKDDEKAKLEALNKLIKDITDKYNQHLVYKHVNVERIYSNKPLFNKTVNTVKPQTI